MDGIAKAKERGVRFGRKSELTSNRVAQIKALRLGGSTVPAIIRDIGLSKASVYRALRMADGRVRSGARILAIQNRQLIGSRRAQRVKIRPSIGAG